MKTATYIIVLLGSFLLSCNSTNKENQAAIKETVKSVKELPKTNDFRDHLKATEPATEAQLKNWLPTQLGELKRMDFTMSRISQNDISSAGAQYKNGNHKTLELTIVDGASKDGLLAIQTHYLAQNTELNNTKASKYEKTYEKNGLKVLETYVKKDDFYRVLFLYDMRFGITVESHGLTYDEVSDAIAQLNLKSLNDM